MASGRPTELTPELQEQIVQALAAGCYVEAAAARVGIRKNTIYDWLRRGAREKTGIYFAFSDAVEKAISAAEVAGLAMIRRAAAEDWRAMAWWLERRYQTRWGRKSAVKIADFGETPDVQAANVVQAAASGELPAEDAVLMMNLLQSQIKIQESTAVLQKLDDLEKTVKLLAGNGVVSDSETG